MSDPDNESPLFASSTTAPPLSPSAATRLKIVRITAARTSFSDAEVPTSQQRLLGQDPYLGATVDDRYRVEAILGQGGMGVVYRCSHSIIGKKVAMKVLRADLARDGEVMERFLNEAKAASAIGNPHIIDISDFGQFPDGATYFIMEYLAGTPLAKAVEGEQPLPLPRLVHIACQLAEALAAAHQAGIVHRDLKPDNVFLIDRGGVRDFVKILDFGIAKVSTTSEGKLTRAGAVFGTPHYMSPEQANGSDVDHRGDIYALGVILYEMATGRVPFDADNFMGILSQHVHKRPPPMRELAPSPALEIPPRLEAIVQKCLSKDREDRYPRMEELLADLEELAASLDPHELFEARTRSSRPPTSAHARAMAAVSTRPAEPARRRWPLLLGLAVPAIALGVGYGWHAERSRTAPTGAERTAAHVALEPAALAADPKTAATLPSRGAPAVRQVVLAAEPLDAHVFRGSADLGPSPVMLQLAESEQVELFVRREGYKEAVVRLDGVESRRVVKLERLPRVGAKSPRQARSADSSAVRRPSSSTEIVNPWE